MKEAVDKNEKKNKKGGITHWHTYINKMLNTVTHTMQKKYKIPRSHRFWNCGLLLSNFDIFKILLWQSVALVAQVVSAYCPLSLWPTIWMVLIVLLWEGLIGFVQLLLQPQHSGQNCLHTGLSLLVIFQPLLVLLQGLRVLNKRMRGT